MKNGIKYIATQGDHVARNKHNPRSRRAKPVASRKAKKVKALPRPVAARKSARRAVAAKAKPKPKRAGARKPAKHPSAPPRKKEGVKVVSAVRGITDEQKKELEHLHGILSDSYVRQMLIDVGGENALEIVRHFYGSHSDEELAKSLQLRISDVRATLNRLHSIGLVQYAREKDSETGWYSYSWSLNKERIVKWVSETAGKGMGSSADGASQYYFCPACGLGSIVAFEEASDKEFRCGKCNKSLEFIEEERFSMINQFLRK